MSAVLHVLAELAAATPTPTPPDVPLPGLPVLPDLSGLPHSQPVTIGQSGAWIGPLALGLLAGLLDYSAAGSGALRDRVAVVGYYASAVSMFAILGLRWTPSADYSWRMAFAVASLITHGALLICWLGRPTAVAKQLSKKLAFNSGASSSAKINQTLLGWTVAAAFTAPLSGNQGWGRVVDTIVTATTGAGAVVLNSVFKWLGG